MKKVKSKEMRKILDYSKNPFHVNPIVKRALRYKKSGTALDLGAGKGRHSFFLAKHGFDVTALDVSKEELGSLRREARKQNLKIECICADMKRWKPEKNYDIILANMSIHFLTAVQVPKIIKKLRQYTNPRGLNVITVHTTQNASGHTRPHLFAKNELKRYYRDWEVLYHVEEWSMPFRVKKEAEPVRRHGAKLIARKP